MAELGFIGVGIMGKPMAGHLMAANHTIHVYDMNPAPVEELAGKGAVACENSKSVAEKSDIIFLMVSDTPDVEEVLFGAGGVAEGIKTGAIVVDMSSISPIATKEFARKLAEMDVEMLDAPVSGGQIGAEQAILSIMIGGKPEIVEKIRPYFELMGKTIVHIGPNGDGQTCKMANQIICALTLEAVSEGLLLAAKAGADPAKVREALLGGFAQSRILDVHGERMIKRDFKPGFMLRLMQKDLNIAIQAARSLGMSVPSAALTQELYNAVAAREGGSIDYCAIVLALEQLADFQLASE
ncbi:2-hydroxy-3-oxopropionate reductase [Thermodesulfobacteriota bacterium]